MDWGDTWPIAPHGDTERSVGISRALFDSLTDHVVFSILEFWTWIAKAADVGTPATSDHSHDDRSTNGCRLAAASTPAPDPVRFPRPSRVVDWEPGFEYPRLIERSGG